MKDRRATREVAQEALRTAGAVQVSDYEWCLGDVAIWFHDGLSSDQFSIHGTLDALPSLLAGKDRITELVAKLKRMREALESIAQHEDGIMDADTENEHACMNCIKKKLIATTALEST